VKQRPRDRGLLASIRSNPTSAGGKDLAAPHKSADNDAFGGSETARNGVLSVVPQTDADTVS
jgi:hypothetical protein